ncbi:hypothetical protein CASFOL_032162 [Castilleja foliolosa]|uniref:Uncharacterized protein n=1 Tax=Castilleja foliolosa TaxID=1961234 RepID=A0ABD3C0R5_9LAMI
MSSPCTSLFRCRVRDLASCFYACRLPLDEEPENGETIFDDAKQMPEKEYLVETLSGNNIVSQGGRVGGDGNGSEPHFAEEDYIVFCFREDGEIDMINEGNNKSSSMKKVDEKSKEKGTNNASKMESLESKISSDTSTSSFAFPKLSLDWIGSPVHMPKSGKTMARNLRIHCCSF